MASAITIKNYLKNINDYIDSYHEHKRSFYFEKLISEAFSHIFYVPFYTLANDDPSVEYRTTWNGTDSTSTRAPPGPDAVIKAYGFHVLIEATMRPGANQWALEFAPALRHCDDYITTQGCDYDHVYAIILAKKLHVDTCESVMAYHHNSTNRLKLLILDVPSLTKIIETSILAFTLMHIDIRKLFEKLIHCSGDAISAKEYLKNINRLVDEWQIEVLKSEKSSFVSFRSYRAMKQIGRKLIGSSDILSNLCKDTMVGRYFKLIDGKISPREIEQSLLENKLAVHSSSLMSGEKFFEPIPFVDLKNCNIRFSEALSRLS